MPSPATVIAFAIIGKGDRPLYEADLSTPGHREDSPNSNQIILYQAIDAVDKLLWTKGDMYLKVVDGYRDLYVSSFCTAGMIKFMILTKQKGIEDKIRSFFLEVHEMYIKILVNPLYEPNGRISSVAFDQRVRLAAKKFLH